mmetsp:Transcript_22594/g.33172  ORF Transcript_22594/g.33172 Transcript_22594/m.33172 type:complete len:146 (-) Transcript_22594:109-546(-)
MPRSGLRRPVVRSVVLCLQRRLKYLLRPRRAGRDQGGNAEALGMVDAPPPAAGGARDGDNHTVDGHYPLHRGVDVLDLGFPAELLPDRGRHLPGRAECPPVPIVVQQCPPLDMRDHHHGRDATDLPHCVQVRARLCEILPGLGGR